jgi:hypothetical protein
MSEPKKAGRPKGSIKPIDIEDLKRWARAGATIPEMAQRLGVSKSTLDTRLAEPEFREALETAKGDMLISLRSKQVAMALAGDRTMLIWLGKQYLGQRDKVEHAGTGIDGAIVTCDGKRERLKAEYDALAERLAARENSGDAGKLPN